MTDKQTLPRRALLGTAAIIASGAVASSATSTDDPPAPDNETTNNNNNTSSTSSTSSEEEDEEEEEEDDEEQEPETEADTTRFAHLAPDVGSVDILVNGHPEFTDIDLHQRTEYYGYSNGTTYRFEVMPAGQEDANGEPLLETELSLSEGPHTLSLIGERCSTSDRPLDLVALEDDYSEIPESHARLLAYHASPDAPALDIRSEDGGDILVENVAFGENAGADIPADGSQQFVTVHETGVEESAGRFKIEPDAGTFYTAIAVGYQNPEAAPSSVEEPLPLSLGVSEDATPG